MLRCLTAFALLALLVATGLSPAQGPAPAWGDLKGQCVRDGSGVPWAFVALVDPNNPKAALPVHPEVTKTLPKKVTLDTPGDRFEPHALGVVAGQIVEVTNTSPRAHNVKFDGGDLNPSPCQIVAPRRSFEVAGWKAATQTVPVSCTINPMLQGYLRVYAHPYFCVTDAQGNFEIKNAPAGTWNLVVWHEDKGYGPGGKQGVPVKIGAGKQLDVGVTKLD